MKIKIHQAYRTIVAVCDSDLVGKTFEEGIRRIEIRPSFFEGEEKKKEELAEILKDLDKEDSTFNIVGEESVQTALEAGIIEKHGIIKIDNIPVALGLM
jgi:hypothetical protein